MKTLYLSDDGRVFDSIADCQQYEKSLSMRTHLGNFLYVYQSHIDDLGLLEFLLKYSTELVDILTDDNEQDQHGWISNEGRQLDCHPEQLRGRDQIEVIYRNGKSLINEADNWSVGWRSADNDPWDIVKYRKI